MYMKRKLVRPRKMKLFKFEMSSHAISMTNYMREQKQEFYGQVRINIWFTFHHKELCQKSCSTHL